MSFIKIFQIFFLLIGLFSCSASYKELTNSKFKPPNEISKYLFEAYKEKAEFEAKEMHDWNSAKLYSEKAIKAAKNNKILPQNISYWKISPDKHFDIIKGYDNLMVIYEEALLFDPYNLAKAISSLDCWSEQQEENWQKWDINKCRNDFFNAMHSLYDIISENKNNEEKISSELKKDSDSVALVTQDVKKKNHQIIYFDFDQSNLSIVSINKIHKFIREHKDIISNFIIAGHTDTKGTKKYNQLLSIERAKTVKKILIQSGVNSKNIKIIGRGESDLRVETNDETDHPANRRAEIGPLKALQ
jgi:OOP family OmpA-OmpF porin